VSQTPQSDLARVRAAAEALRREIVDDPDALGARLEEAIPVRSAMGELDSWFVALTSDDFLLGFFQLEPDLSLHRYSTFQRTPGSTSGCPSAATWLDPATIRERARTAAAEGNQLEQPILSYHGNRDRLAWRVPVANRRTSIYVIGDEVYTDAA
jgi:hypothetical protein